ncbi:GH116 family glycosyl-hydrolase [Pontiella sulfatireligans]|uniref:Glycosyl-hydrolase family 116 catalytic region domain-containing protein n=1 Tax=Pontiella sulfatireligans TaxID=2750658 RepID=A0A6C2UHQ5_9BACT|nr:GH116 family glycosyl-hydrolase [Pontiella sulfatireligans]VGO18746.1 hypothetical protein SCARR_00799 [Pontiella sulfatireligans]
MNTKNCLNAILSLACCLSVVANVSLASGLDRDEIMKQLQLDSEGKSAVQKNFPSSFPEALTARGEPIVYTRENSENFEYIGMPIGGIGAGQLYLGGDGQLWFWDIYGLNYRKGQLKGSEAYEKPYKRSEIGIKGNYMPEQGFSISTKSNGKCETKKLNRDGMQDIEFLGQYPIGEVSYRDPDMPVEVKLEAFSPFIPLDLDNSVLPATVMSFTVRNISDQQVEAMVSGWLQNTILASAKKAKKFKGQGKRKNTVVSLPEGGLRIDYSAELSGGEEAVKELTNYGTMSLALLGDGVTAEKTEAELNLTDKTPLMGQLDKAITLAPGESKTATFILTWHFPVSRALYTEGRRMVSGEDYLQWSTRYYAKLFPDAFAVSDYLIEHFDRLASATRLWRDTWYDSTLPYWFLDRTFLNTSILASSTSHVLNDKMFYGTEGGNQGPGTVHHVWGYVQAMGRLFPDLEKSLREQVDFLPIEEGGAYKQSGVVCYRWFCDKTERELAVDGQSGLILRTYLAHQMSKDDAWLKKVYPGMKKVMEGLTRLRDADHDGILTGEQPNTLDGIWFGKVTWLSLHYTTALRAAAEMADEVGDHEYAAFCRATADKGRLYIEENLFNGEYFIHEGNPDEPKSPGTYTGLEYSQLFGQSWAYQVGLGEVIDPAKAKTALESMWRYNFSTDVGPYRETHTGGRWFAMPGEGGLIACTWPRGGSEVLKRGKKHFADYNNECQNGYEYAATSLMMWHDMPYHSLAHIWYMHNDRYHGSKRNPWCEVEWGIHYARSMASYGHFTAVGGFEYHGPKGHLGFAPKITPEHFKSAFTAAEGWGSFEQTRTGDAQTEIIQMVFGTLQLRTLSFEMAEGHEAKKVSMKLAGKSVEGRLSQVGQRVAIELKTPITIEAGTSLNIELR